MEKGDLLRKYGIDIKELIEEQKKLVKLISLKDSLDFSLIQTIAGCMNLPVKNNIISGIVVLNQNFEIIEQQYAIGRPRFPYIAEFRAYRELRTMVEAYKKLQEPADVFFVDGHGIAHPRRLGIASHFGLAIQKPVIGIAKNILSGKIKNRKIYIYNKVVGEEVIVKKGSNPIYVSPGNMITLKTAVELTKKFVKEPHKLPEPLVQARKYIKKIMNEILNL